MKATIPCNLLSSLCVMFVMKHSISSSITKVQAASAPPPSSLSLPKTTNSNPMSTPEVKDILLPHMKRQQRDRTDELNYFTSRQRRKPHPHKINGSDLTSILNRNDDDMIDNELSYEIKGEEEIELALPSSFQTPPFLQHPTLSSRASSSSATKQTIPTPQQYRKTGTTIVGCIANNGRTIILGADTRATDGTVVADKRCEKVHALASNVWCCGAGTSGDIDALVRLTRYTFWLRGKIQESIGNIQAEENDEKDEDKGGIDENGYETCNMDQEIKSLPTASVSSISRFLQDKLYESKGSIGANLVLGGYDYASSCAVLMAIHPHGSIDIVPYSALGSGGLAAMSILESKYRQSLSEEEGIRLVQDAVKAGIENDMGSGSQIDLCIIDANGVRYKRALVEEETLPWSKGDAVVDEVLRQRHLVKENENEIMGGVNGFGSLPYSIKSRRMIMECEEDIKGRHCEWLDNIIDMGS